MSRRSDPLWDLGGPEYEARTEILNNNSQMLVDILKGIKMDMPTPEEYGKLSNADIKDLICDYLFELKTRRGRDYVLDFFKATVLELCGPTNAEPFLPIAHRN